jgi:4'-phosphopantetheinyl transferase
LPAISKKTKRQPMPLILKHTINESTSLGVWKIIETVESMTRLIELDENARQYFGTFGNELRRKHWLSYRLILRELLPAKNMEIIYDEYGKPGMPDFNGHFSVSHSGDFASAIVSYETPVGTDIERIRDRIERVAERFLTLEELDQVGYNDRLEKLHIYWGAKESLYKLNGKPNVDLQKDIRIEPFDYLCIDEGICRATMNTPGGVGSYNIFYRKIEDYILVWALSLV